MSVCGLAVAAPKLTYHREIAPPLQKHCQTCHRAGEAVPVTLTSYAEVRPWAKAIKQAVGSRKMPPWFADPYVGHFTNGGRMSPADLATLTAWIDQGAPEGNAKDAPLPVQFAEGWAIGQPDAVLEMPESVPVPASGTVDYTYIIVPTGFTEDKWHFAEARPGDRSVVHHIIVFAREPGSRWLSKYPVNKAFVPRGGGDGGGQFITGFAPGSPPEALREGQGKLIKAGSDLVFQMHYTANGKATADRSRIGMRFARTTPTQRVLTLAAVNSKFVIPPGAAAHVVDGATTLHQDTELIGLLPHMHLRGKLMEIRAACQNRKVNIFLRFPGYEFNWQLWYQLQRGKHLPAGTRIEATGTFDNSGNNRNNPDYKAEVRQGEQSWEEMMTGFFNIAFDAQIDPMSVIRAPKRTPPGPSGGND
ncbi:MAG: cytochrome c [Acidobacteria bacterium]|nr:cytochrome c [Acidobacteriota bacterium]